MVFPDGLCRIIILILHSTNSIPLWSLAESVSCAADAAPILS